VALGRLDRPRTGGVEARPVRDEAWPEGARSRLIELGHLLSLQRYEAVLAGGSAIVARRRPLEKIRLEDPAAKPKLALQRLHQPWDWAINFSGHVSRPAGDGPTKFWGLAGTVPLLPIGLRKLDSLPEPRNHTRFATYWTHG
jgi:hypothetical protein